MTKEVRAKISKASKTMWSNEDCRNKISKSISNSWKNEDIRNKRMQGLLIVTQSEQYRNSQSTKLKERYQDETLRKKVSIATKLGQKVNNAYEKISNAGKLRFSNIDERLRASDYTKKVRSTKESRIKTSKANILNWTKLSYRQNQAKGRKHNKQRYSWHELEGLKLLQQVFPDIVHHYTSKAYPFDCDYYVPSKDLYIEGHFGWYHNGRPFIGTEQDMRDLENFQEKAKLSNNYANKVYQWTDLDVRKRQTARQNGINFVEVYSLEELMRVFNIKETAVANI